MQEKRRRGQEMIPQQNPMQGEESQEPSDANGFEVCIQVWSDGTIQVTREPLDVQEEQGESAGQPANSIEEALQIAQTMLSEESQEDPNTMQPEDVTTEGAEDVGMEDAFASGFKAVRGNGLNR